MINQPTLRMIQRRKELLGRRGLKKQERDYAIDNVIVTTSAGNKFNGEDKSQGRMTSALLAASGTCAPRRIPIGTQYLPVGAVIGQNCTPIDINFDVPLVVEPSKYFHLILKMVVGTATASQIIRGTCFVNGYFE